MSLLQDRLSVAKYPAGYTIVHQGDQDSDLLYVLTGHLSVVQTRVSQSRANSAFSSQ